VNDRQREIILETLGLHLERRPVKNYYFTRPGHPDHADIEALAEAGWLEVVRTTTRGEWELRATLAGVRLAVGIRIPDAAIDRWLSTGRWPTVVNGDLVERVSGREVPSDI
jgi:hypothetical protein